MSKTIFIVAALATMAFASTLQRSKRQATYDLPDGAELLLGSIRSTFQCTQDGYFADVDNNCQIFHVCHTATHPDGRSETARFSFLCGNQTVFDQLSLTCASEFDAIPCQAAADFFYLNAKIGQEKAFFLEENDILKADQVKATRRS